MKASSMWAVAGWTVAVVAAPGIIVVDPKDICKEQPRNLAAKHWELHRMDDYLSQFSKGPWDKPLVKTLGDKLPSARDFNCHGTGQQDDCSNNAFSDANICMDDPKAWFALRAINNYFTFVKYVADVYHKQIAALNSGKDSWQSTFDPGKTAEYGKPDFTKEDRAKGESVLSFVGSLAALNPTTAPIGNIFTVTKALSDLFGDDTPQLVDRAKTIAELYANGAQLGAYFDQIETTVEKWKSRAHDAMIKKTPSEDSIKKLQSYLARGAFASPPETFSEEAKDGVRAALAAPGINAIWNRAGVVIAKVRPNNFPMDLCKDDSVFAKSTKVCINNEAFILRGPANPQLSNGRWSFHETSQNRTLTNPSGLANLTNFNLNMRDIVQLSHDRQRANNGQPRPDPPSAESVLQTYLEKGTLSPEQYLPFNIPVCDFEHNKPFDDLTQKWYGLDSFCGPRSDPKNTGCWFQVELYNACPHQDWRDGAYPVENWKPEWFQNGFR